MLQTLFGPIIPIQNVAHRAVTVCELFIICLQKSTEMESKHVKNFKAI